MKPLFLILLLAPFYAETKAGNDILQIETANTPPRMPTLTTTKLTEDIELRAKNSTLSDKTNCTDTQDSAKSSNEPLFIDSYLAPSMQAIAYYIELLQYETLSMTTIEPPFSGWEAEGGTTYKPPPTPPRPSTTTTTKSSTVWWKPPSTQSTIWWVPPSTTKRTTTQRPESTTQFTTTKKPYSTTSSTYNDGTTEATTQWWQTTIKTTKKPISTIASTTQTWWQPPSWWTTSKPEVDKRTTTAKTTTQRPITTTNPPETTPPHRPGVFAPTALPIITQAIPINSIQSQPMPPSSPIAFASNYRPQYTSLNRRPDPSYDEYRKTTEQLKISSQKLPKALNIDGRRNIIDSITDDDNKATSSLLSTSEILPASAPVKVTTAVSGTGSMLSHQFDKDFYSWFTQQKAKIYKHDYEYDFQLLDPLPGALIRDIIQEKSELPAISDIDNINEFLKVYDDNFGRSNSITGKKKVPITKPYVEFLMLYDLLKRDAKAMNLSKYEGYSEEMLNELAELSQRSAERQLHALLTRMLLRNDIDRADTITRCKGIIKDLETPTSITAKAMRYFPPLKFVP